MRPGHRRRQSRVRQSKKGRSNPFYLLRVTYLGRLSNHSWNITNEHPLLAQKDLTVPYPATLCVGFVPSVVHNPHLLRRGVTNCGAPLVFRGLQDAFQLTFWARSYRRKAVGVASRKLSAWPLLFCFACGRSLTGDPVSNKPPGDRPHRADTSVPPQHHLFT